MKTKALTVHRSPARVRRGRKQRGKAALRRFAPEDLQFKRQAPEKPISGKEIITILRKFQKMFTPEEHKQIAARIEEARRRMAHEHLH